MKSVDILLATYKPNISFFEKLLISLNNQTYHQISLLIRDDSDDIEEHEKIKNLVSNNITNFKYQIFQNSENLGSNKTFEQLTKDSSAELLAYCDQDDIWEKEKIEKLVKNLEREKAVLSYSDLSVIDENDYLKANSFKDIHKRLRHLDGDNLFEFFLRRNSVTGCSMLIKSEVAKAAMPFCHEFYVHDHWLALNASAVGKIGYISEPLVRYRIHDNNQIGASMLNGIDSKEDYIEKKLKKEKKRFECLLSNYKFNKQCQSDIKKSGQWVEERISFFENNGLKNFVTILKNIKDDYQLTLFEIVINYSPDKFRKSFFSKIKQ